MGRLLDLLSRAVIVAAVTGCGAKTGLHDHEASPAGCVDVDPASRAGAYDAEVSVRLRAADVVFVLDCTGSMAAVIGDLQRGLASTIVPGAVSAIPDVRFGVVVFSDLPYTLLPSPDDEPFTLLQRVTDDVDAIQSVLDDLPGRSGGDEPEALVEALYQVATGEGLGEYIEPAPPCAPDERGAPCFRDDA